MMDLLRNWWLESAGDPALLFMVRILSCVLALMASGVWLMLGLKTPISESTWARRDIRAFRVVVTCVGLALLVAAAYYFTAGMIEQARTSSPHRLIVANVANATLFLSLSLLGAFLRLAFTRKRAIKAARAVGL